MKRIKTLAAVVAIVAAYVWDDLLFGAPVTVVAKWVDPWMALVIFTLIYSIGSWLIAKRFILGRVSKPSGRAGSWVVSQLEQLFDSTHSKLGKRLLRAGGAFGFIVSSWLAGGIITTYLLEKGGYRGDILRASASSCLIFGLLFSAQYAGIGALL